MSTGPALPSEQQVTARWRGDASVPLVSVLCHVYNQCAYVEDALGSILRQATDFPFELIVRDDASSDGTTQVVAAYAERYPGIVRALFESENRYRQGVKPITTTFPLVRGELVAFCEGDDYWLGQDKLQKQVEFMHAHPDCGLVHGNFLNLINVSGIWRTRLAFRKPRQLEHRAGNIYSEMLQANRIQTCTVLIKRELMSQYRASGLGVDSYCVADWPLFLYIAHESKVGYINAPIAAYRRTSGSVTNSGDETRVRFCQDAIRMVNDFCDYFQDAHAIRQAALVAQFRTLLILAFRAGDRRQFNLAKNWLSINSSESSPAWKVYAMSVLIGWPKIRCMLLSLFSGLESFAHRITFRKAGTESIQE
jgi:hypothetical protein